MITLTCLLGFSLYPFQWIVQRSAFVLQSTNPYIVQSIAFSRRHNDLRPLSVVISSSTLSSLSSGVTQTECHESSSSSSFSLTLNSPSRLYLVSVPAPDETLMSYSLLQRV